MSERLALIAELRTLHTPERVEVEVYHRSGDDPSYIDGECPEPDPRWPNDPCPGHTVTIETCAECGEGDNGSGDLGWNRYPCRTIRTLDKYDGQTTIAHDDLTPAGEARIPTTDGAAPARSGRGTER